MPDKRYSKLEEEIIQILDKFEDERPHRPRPNLRLVKQPTPRKRWDPFALLRKYPFAYILLSFAFALAALSLRDTSATLAAALAIVATLVFFAPLALARRSPTGSASIDGKQWRGRDIVFTSSDGASPLDRARRWMERYRR